MAAERGHVVGTLLSLSAAGPMFDAYRKRAQELGPRNPHLAGRKAPPQPFRQNLEPQDHLHPIVELGI
jgi:hypothetical protein